MNYEEIQLETTKTMTNHKKQNINHLNTIFQTTKNKKTTKLLQKKLLNLRITISFAYTNSCDSRSE